MQATTSVCASGTFGSWSRTPTGAVADRMCFDGSLNVGASETGVMICTDGSVDAQETPWMVVVVGLPAPSFSVTVMSNGAPPGQVTGTHASRVDRGDGGRAGAAGGAAERDAQVVDPGAQRRGQAGRVGGRRAGADVEPALAIELGRTEELSGRRLT